MSRAALREWSKPFLARLPRTSDWMSVAESWRSSSAGDRAICLYSTAQIFDSACLANGAATCARRARRHDHNPLSRAPHTHLTCGNSPSFGKNTGRCWTSRLLTPSSRCTVPTLTSTLSRLWARLRRSLTGGSTADGNHGILLGGSDGVGVPVLSMAPRRGSTMRTYTRQLA